MFSSSPDSKAIFESCFYYFAKDHEKTPHKRSVSFISIKGIQNLIFKDCKFSGLFSESLGHTKSISFLGHVKGIDEVEFNNCSFSNLSSAIFLHNTWLTKLSVYACLFEKMNHSAINLTVEDAEISIVGNCFSNLSKAGIRIAFNTPAKLQSLKPSTILIESNQFKACGDGLRISKYKGSPREIFNSKLAIRYNTFKEIDGFGLYIEKIGLADAIVISNVFTNCIEGAMLFISSRAYSGFSVCNNNLQSNPKIAILINDSNLILRKNDILNSDIGIIITLNQNRLTDMGKVKE